MKKGAYCIAILSAVLLLGWQARTASALMMAYEFKQLAAEAKDIVQVVVIKQENRFSLDGATTYTLVTFKPLDILKGGRNIQKEFSLFFEGGVMPNGTHLFVEDIPRFEKGREYILFLLGEENYFCPVVGGEQGVFKVEMDADRNSFILDYEGRDIIGIKDGELVKNPLRSQDNQKILMEHAASPQIKNDPKISLEKFKEEIINLLQKLSQIQNSDGRIKEKSVMQPPQRHVPILPPAKPNMRKPLGVNNNFHQGGG